MKMAASIYQQKPLELSNPKKLAAICRIVRKSRTLIHTTKESPNPECRFCQNIGDISSLQVFKKYI